MHIEYECTLLEVNREEFIKLLESHNAKKIGDYFQRRYTYDFKPKVEDKWIRLRTNGETTTLTIKQMIDKNKIGGNHELEIEVSDFDETNQILNEMGFKYRNYQENKRTIYVLDDIEFDIDSWPLIPEYVEIEGKSSEAVKKIIKKLKLDESKITTYDVTSIYENIYGINILDMKELKFKEDKNE